MPVYRVFLPFAFGYVLSYLYRVVNAVIADDLIDALGLEADGLGLLTGAYFLTFAACQVPLGLALDRYGPRRTEGYLLIVAAVGSLVFALGNDLTDLIIGRALIGIGVSACLMAAFKAFIMWFPRERLPSINGMQMAAGGLGAVLAATPVERFLGIADWRDLFMLLAGLTLCASAAVLLVVPKSRDPRPPSAGGPIWAGFKMIYTSRLFWCVATPTVFSQATFLAIQGLWSGPWMQDVGELSRSEMAIGLSVTAFAMIAGFLCLGWVAGQSLRWGLTPLRIAFFGMGCFLAVQGLIITAWTPSIYALWALFGFFGTSGIIPYAALSQKFPTDVAGRLNTGLNVLVFVIAFTVQWGIGAVIDQWPAQMDGGYAADGYRAAFAIMIGLQTVALFGAWVFRPRNDG